MSDKGSGKKKKKDVPKPSREQQMLTAVANKDAATLTTLIDEALHIVDDQLNQRRLAAGSEPFDEASARLEVCNLVIAINSPVYVFEPPVVEKKSARSTSPKPVHDTDTPLEAARPYLLSVFASEIGFTDAVPLLMRLPHLNLANVDPVNGDSLLISALLHHHDALVSTLVESHISNLGVSIRNVRGQSALDLAVAARNVSLCVTLVSHSATYPFERDWFIALAAADLDHCKFIVSVIPTIGSVRNARGQNAFHIAAALQNEELLTWLGTLDPKVPPRVVSHDGLCAVDVAMASPEFLTAFLKVVPTTGAELDSVHRSGFNALHLAIQGRNNGLVEQLLLLGASVDVPDAREKSTSLHYASVLADDTLAKLLIAKGATVDKQNAAGDTALHRAVRWNRASIVSSLLAVTSAASSLGKSANWKGYTALHMAADHGHAEVAQLLLQSKVFDVEAQTLDGQSALSLAIHKGHISVALVLLTEGKARTSCTPALLHECIHKKYVPIALKMIELHVEGVGKKAEAARLAEEAKKAEEEAAKSKKPPPKKDPKAPEPAPAVVEPPFELDLEALDENGRSPLLASIQDGCHEVSLALISAGVTVTSVDESGHSLLHACAKHGAADALASILSSGRGPHVDVLDGNQHTPLFVAAQYDGPSLLCSDVLLRSGASVVVRDGKQWTPLHAACQYKNAALVERLLSIAATEIDAVDENGCSPLHVACAVNASECAAALLVRGAAPDRENAVGDSALFVATRGGAVEAGKVVVAHLESVVRG